VGSVHKPRTVVVIYLCADLFSWFMRSPGSLGQVDESFKKLVYSVLSNKKFPFSKSVVILESMLRVREMFQIPRK
jgi:hypothetical protein